MNVTCRLFQHSFLKLYIKPSESYMCEKAPILNYEWEKYKLTEDKRMCMELKKTDKRITAMMQI